MIAEFAVFPLDGDHMSEDVAQVIKTLEAGASRHPAVPPGGRRGPWTSHHDHRD